MKLLYKSIILADWLLAKLFWIPVEIVAAIMGAWFSLVTWAEEELHDASSSN